MKHLPLLILAAVSSLALTLPAAAQTLSVTSLTPSGSTQMTVIIRNTGPATSFQLQSSPSLTTGTWTNITAPFTGVPGQSGFFTTTFTKPAGTRMFFRVLGSTNNAGTAGDADGDGLSDVFESTPLPNGTGTNANLFDSDGDGFSDGIEFASGTSPLLASSKPNDGFPPAASFESRNLEAMEGTPSTVRVVFDRAFTGTVKYNVLTTRSTAQTPVDYIALSGTLAVNGTSATFPVTWIDDLEVQPVRVLFISLVTNPGQNYITGQTDFLTIRLTDNDSYWQGSLAGHPDSGAEKSFIQRNFRMKFTQNASLNRVHFVAGPGFDGLPALAGELPATATSQSEGVIPGGAWLAGLFASTPTDFRATSPPMPIPAAGGGIGTGGSLFGSVPDMRRTLELNAVPGVTPYNMITPTLIGGRFIETQASVSAPHLNVQASGMFVLLKELPATPPIPSFLVP